MFIGRVLEAWIRSAALRHIFLPRMTCRELEASTIWFKNKLTNNNNWLLLKKCLVPITEITSYYAVRQISSFFHFKSRRDDPRNPPVVCVELRSAEDQFHVLLQVNQAQNSRKVNGWQVVRRMLALNRSDFHLSMLSFSRFACKGHSVTPLNFVNKFSQISMTMKEENQSERWMETETDFSARMTHRSVDCSSIHASIKFV